MFNYIFGKAFKALLHHIRRKEHPFVYRCYVHFMDSFFDLRRVAQEGDNAFILIYACGDGVKIKSCFGIESKQTAETLIAALEDRADYLRAELEQDAYEHKAGSYSPLN